MISKVNNSSKNWRLLIASATLFSQPPVFSQELEKHSSVAYKYDNTVAPEAGPKKDSSINNKSFILHGKAEVTEQLGNNLQAWQAAQIYKQGVAALSAQRYALATRYFKMAGDGFAAAGSNEKYMAESRFAEAQSRRLLGQKQLAVPLYQESIALFRQYDSLNPYLQAALDNLKDLTPPLQGRVGKTDARLKALASMTSIQAVDRNIILKGRVTDLDPATALGAEKSSSDVTDLHIKKTVLQAFVKMTCLETAELGSTYYNAADKYVPLKADGRNVTVSASSGFTAPIINIKLNGRYYNVGVDLPELTGSHKTVYLVTDGKNILAIDPATYDVWKLTAKLGKRSADFDWQKLTHQKDIPKRISL